MPHRGQTSFTSPAPVTSLPSSRPERRLVIGQLGLLFPDQALLLGALLADVQLVHEVLLYLADMDDGVLQTRIFRISWPRTNYT